jgi:uncharacterized protein (DUF927 family)
MVDELPMAYDIIMLNPKLYLIRWQRFPSAVESQQFIRALEELLNKVDHKISFLSDLRKGYIKELSLINKLSRVAAHHNCAHTTAFGSVGSQVYAGMFQKLITKPRDKREGDTWFTLEQALAYLEKLEPGITEGVNFAEVAHP